MRYAVRETSIKSPSLTGQRDRTPSAHDSSPHASQGYAIKPTKPSAMLEDAWRVVSFRKVPKGVTMRLVEPLRVGS